MSTALPPLNIIKVGMPRILNLPGMSGLASTSTLRDFDFPRVFCGNLFEDQCNHLARTAPLSQKSTRTGTSLESTSASKLSSVTCWISALIGAQCLVKSCCGWENIICQWKNILLPVDHQASLAIKAPRVTANDTSVQRWWVYLLECADHTLYTGVTTDLARRVDQHNGMVAGGARYTRAHDLSGSFGQRCATAGPAPSGGKSRFGNWVGDRNWLWLRGRMTRVAYDC